jgi:ATP-binding protein involved in chromosome partitioning
MKIAIPLANKKLCMHFGHCQEFALIEVDTENKKIINKEFRTPPPHEPGILPKWLAENNANIIIAGGMGSRAQNLFKENGITVVVGAGSIEPEELVNSYINGSLKTGDNACDH